MQRELQDRRELTMVKTFHLKNHLLKKRRTKKLNQMHKRKMQRRMAKTRLKMKLKVNLMPIGKKLESRINSSNTKEKILKKE